MRLFLLVLTLLPIISKAQTVAEVKTRIANVKTEEDAEKFLLQNDSVVGQVSSFDSTYALFEYLQVFERGEVMTIEPDKYPDKINLFKVLDKHKIQSFHIQYIYLDAVKLGLTQIDSLRKLIVKKHADGESFDGLARQYSMDGNAAKGGVLTWKEGEMVKEFEHGIKEHSLGEVFTIDIPDEKWFYVVKNSERPKMAEVITVLYIELKK